jgi:hypothetical protein
MRAFESAAIFQGTAKALPRRKFGRALLDLARLWIFSNSKAFALALNPI